MADSFSTFEHRLDLDLFAFISLFAQMIVILFIRNWILKEKALKHHSFFL